MDCDILSLSLYCYSKLTMISTKSAIDIFQGKFFRAKISEKFEPAD